VLGIEPVATWKAALACGTAAVAALVGALVDPGAASASSAFTIRMAPESNADRRRLWP
jgi:hypothetical protein